MNISSSLDTFLFDMYFNLVRNWAWNFKIVATTIRKLSNDSSRTNKKKERNWNCLVGFCSSSTFQGFLQVHSICLCWRRLLLRTMGLNIFWWRFPIFTHMQFNEIFLQLWCIPNFCWNVWQIVDKHSRKIRMLLEKGFDPFLLESKREKRAKQPLMDTFFIYFLPPSFLLFTTITHIRIKHTCRVTLP